MSNPNETNAQAFVLRLLTDEAFNQQFEASETAPEKLGEWGRAHGYTFTDEELASAFQEAAPYLDLTGEGVQLSEEQLASAAGGIWGVVARVGVMIGPKIVQFAKLGAGLLAGSFGIKVGENIVNDD